MTPAQLEHANITVRDPARTAQWMADVFGWQIRWQGPAKLDGHTIHCGGADSYIALYTPPGGPGETPADMLAPGGLNHIAVTVEDLDATEARVKAAGFTPMNHADYEPGRRFYFTDTDGVEYEVVQY